MGSDAGRVVKAAGRQSYRSQWEQKFRRGARASGVPRGAIGTGLMMQTYADVDGTSITVSQETLARQQGVTSRTIRNDQTSLEDCGWIRVVHRGNGPGNPNEHRLAIPEVDFRISAETTPPIRKPAARNAETEHRKCGSQFPTTMGNHGTIRTLPSGNVQRWGEAAYVRLVRTHEMTTPEKHCIGDLSQTERADWHARIEDEANLP